ncbi:MAG: RNA 2',3'-cyclic phosphodiesterase [Tissierellia bacterium]|nr:RNA 2',3'-cyclic phosphodiesterase [Tissierellia bacterium]
MRLFIAVDLSESALKKIADYQKEILEISEKASITKITNIHLTIKFIGETEKSKIDSILKALRIVAKKTSSFEIELSKLGYFKRRGNYLIWVGLENSRQLQRLKKEIEFELCKIGFKPDLEDYLPHITIARRVKFKGGVSALDDIDTDIVKIYCSKFSLYSSQFTKNGVRYKSISDFYLK